MSIHYCGTVSPEVCKTPEGKSGRKTIPGSNWTYRCHWHLAGAARPTDNVDSQPFIWCSDMSQFQVVPNQNDANNWSAIDWDTFDLFVFRHKETVRTQWFSPIAVPNISWARSVLKKELVERHVCLRSRNSILSIQPSFYRRIDDKLFQHVFFTSTSGRNQSLAWWRSLTDKPVNQ